MKSRLNLVIGGMATVYRAYDPSFERDVALKVLKRELLEDPDLRLRFERETKIVAKLEHAAIVTVHDVGFDHDQMFYVMRYTKGGSLAERIEFNRLELDQIAYILLRLADALDYAHRKGIVHRDLKPGNILFDENDNAYISDFDIAKFAPNIVDINPDLPPEIGEVFKKILEKGPDNRYPSMGEFAHKFLEALPPSTIPISKLITPVPPQPHPKPKGKASAEPMPDSMPRSNSRNWLIGGGIAVALIGLFFWGYSRRNQTAAPPVALATASATIAPSATSTSSPTQTNIPSPTTSPEPTATIFVDPGIGGATHIALVLTIPFISWTYTVVTGYRFPIPTPGSQNLTCSGCPMEKLCSMANNPP